MSRISILKFTFLVTYLIVIPYSAFSQFKVKARLIDTISNTGIPQAHITNLRTNKVYISNEDGSFEIEAKRLPVNISITHISYKNKKCKLKYPNQKFHLSHSNYELKAVSIIPEKPENIIKETKLYVLDYNFKGDSIIMLAYKNRKTKNSKIMILEDNGDTLKSKKIDKMESLYKDIFDNHHLVCKNYAYQIHPDSTAIKLLYPVFKDSLFKTFEPIVEKIDQNYLFRLNYYSNQLVQFYLYNSLDSSFKLFYEFADNGGFERLSDKHRLQSSDGYSAADARFEEMCFYNKKHIPIVKLNNKLYLFNYLIDSLLVFNTEGKHLTSTHLRYHKFDKWEKKLFIDESTKKIYTLFKDGSISYIKQIDLKNGNTAKSIKIPEFRHVENIKIHNDKVYFLYKEEKYNNYKQLYCMNL